MTPTDPMTGDEPSVETPGSTEEGGEEACLLHRLCPECGAVLEGQRPTCWRCGTTVGRDTVGGEHAG